jgi:predicted acyltransferase
MNAAELEPPATAPGTLAATVQAGERIRSIDVLRGLTILVMIFVNDVAGVHATPGWMKHIQPPGADGMTFVDVVFPAFLFIVGLSIPTALERRLGRGSTAGTLGHVLVRTLGLLVLGVFMVNMETPSPNGVLSPHLFSLLVYLAAMLVWVAVPQDARLAPGTRRAIRLAGAGLLAMLALLFRGKGPPALLELHHSWWGILGLIGWAYLVASAAYLLLRGNVPALIGGVVLLYGLFFADAAGAFSGLTWITRWVGIGSMLGSHAALTLSGVVFGAVLLPGSSARTHGARLRWALAYGAFMAAAAWLLHSGAGIHKMFIINKIAATPPWCLYSAAITIWIWAGLYWLLDVRGTARPTSVLERAGQNALLAYILAPIAYDLFDLGAGAVGARNPYWVLGNSFAPGLGRALVFALALTWLAAIARRKGFVLKL